MACELGARVDGVRRQRVGVFVSAGEAVGGACGIGVPVLTTPSSRPAVSGGLVDSIVCIVPSFSYFSEEDPIPSKIPHFTNTHTALATPFLELQKYYGKTIYFGKTK